MADAKNPDDIIYDANDPILDAALRAQAWAKLKRDQKKVAPSQADSKTQSKPAPAPVRGITPLTYTQKADGSFTPLAPVQRVVDKFYRERDLGGIERQMEVAAQRLVRDPSESNKDAYKSWKEAYGRTIALWEQENGRKYTRIDVNPTVASNGVTGPAKTDTKNQSVPGVTGTATVPNPSTTPTTTNASNVVVAGGAPGAVSNGYSNYSGTAGSPFVNVPGRTFTNTPMGPNATLGIVSMTPDAALSAFIKGLYTDSPDALSLVSQMNKFGIDTSKMSKSDIAGYYEQALKDTATAITAGATGYNVLKSLQDIGTKIKTNGNGSPRNTSNTVFSKKIYTEDEFRTIGNTVAQNLLGRSLSDDEIKKALATANTESLKNPSKTVTNTNYSGDGSSSTSNSTSSGGYNATASLENKISQTGESQAYTTNNLFNDAMTVLSRRIG
jgi:hypothetical protein